MRRWSWIAAVLMASACNWAERSVPPERMPRFEPMTTHPRVALVLGSGGPRGFAHIGVLKALDAAGVHPDLVVGSSVGAMVGALYAGGYTPGKLEDMAYALNMLEFLEPSMMWGGAASGRAVQAFVNKGVHDRPMEALGVPFAAVATRLSDRKLVVFNHGDTGLAVRASGASPGQFKPVRIGNDMYIDGDEDSPVPIRIARQLGAQVVIAVDVSAYLEQTPQGVPQDWIDKDERRARQIRAEAPQADVLIHPDIGYYAGYEEGYRRRVIAIAEEATREAMPKVLAAVAKAAPSSKTERANSAR